MVKNTLKNTMSEVYNVTNNNATFKKNVYDFNSKLNTLNTSKNTNNMLKSKNMGSKNMVNNNNSNTPSNSSFSNSFESKEKVSSFISFLPYILLFLFVVVCIFMIFRYKDKIREIIEKYFSETPTNNEKEKELEQKIKDEKEKVSQLEKEKEETKKEETKKEKTKETKKKSVESPLKQQYSESQIVKEDGYCFIGTDNQMRHCVDAYSGDICTSGDIYRRMDDCLIPKLSSNNQQCYF